jgi:hypothetical protein
MRSGERELEVSGLRLAVCLLLAVRLLLRDRALYSLIVAPARHRHRVLEHQPVGQVAANVAQRAGNASAEKSSCSRQCWFPRYPRAPRLSFNIPVHVAHTLLLPGRAEAKPNPT